MVALLAACAMAARAMEDGERRRIGHLISSVEGYAGARFVRNGSEYDGKAAAEHLRMKLGKAGSRVRTAEDFIRLCASRSYLSGQPYLIRRPDGTTVTAEAFFREKLAEYDSARGTEGRPRVAPGKD